MNPNALPLQVRVNLEVIAMKGYFTFSKAPRHLLVVVMQSISSNNVNVRGKKNQLNSEVRAYWCLECSLDLMLAHSLSYIKKYILHCMKISLNSKFFQEHLSSLGLSLCKNGKIILLSLNIDIMVNPIENLWMISDITI